MHHVDSQRAGGHPGLAPFVRPANVDQRQLARYRYDTRAAPQHVNCPVLILHSPEDEIIPFSQGLALLEAAREPKRLVELRGGHNDALLLSREVYSQSVGTFLQKVLPGHGGE